MQNDVAKAIHDINNSLGAAIMNLEVVTSKKLADGLCLEAVTAALEELNRLDRQIKELEALIGNS